MHQTGPLGELLATVIAYETGRWELISQYNLYGINLSKLYIDSLNKISQSVKVLQD